MRRRDFIRLVGMSPALPLVARAQQGATSGRVAKLACFGMRAAPRKKRSIWIS